VVPVPAALRPLETLSEQDAVRSREFSLRKQSEPCAGSMWLINDLVWHDVTEYPRLDTTEIWRFVNRSGVMHPMHMHLVMFQVLDRQDFIVQGEDIIPVGDPIPPDPNEFGWKDTVKTYPSQITRVIARFEDYTGRYPYHCHILEHEDHEMMRQFEALPPCPWDCARPPNDVVDTVDFLDLLAHWGVPGGNGPCDFDGNGVVDTVDFLALLAHWGTCPGPGP
jgi:spore coat protein A